jgi:hypothetical protein
MRGAACQDIAAHVLSSTDWHTGQQTGLSGLAATSPGPTPGMNFCQSPDTIVGASTIRAPSA